MKDITCQLRYKIVIILLSHKNNPRLATEVVLYIIYTYPIQFKIAYAKRSNVLPCVP